MTKDKKDLNTLPIDEVSAQERSVTIRVLTVGTKQITQALYKQLINEDILGYNANIKGNVWGWVNFHYDGCSGYEGQTHLHAVWDNGIALRRCTLPLLPKLDRFYSRLKAAGTAFTCALVLEGQTTDIKEQCDLLINDRQVTVKTTQSARELVWQYKNGHCNGEQKKAEEINRLKEEVKNDIHDYLIRANILPSLQSSLEISKEIEEKEKDLTKYENTWAENWREIKATNQLFIAVSGVWK